MAGARNYDSYFELESLFGAFLGRPTGLSSSSQCSAQSEEYFYRALLKDFHKNSRHITGKRESKSFEATYTQSDMPTIFMEILQQCPIEILFRLCRLGCFAIQSSIYCFVRVILINKNHKNNCNSIMVLKQKVKLKPKSGPSIRVVV